MYKLLVSSTIVIVLSSPLSAFQLKWDLPINDRIEAVRTATVEHLKDNHLTKTYEERNIIDLTCIEAIYENRKVAGEFTVYHRDPGEKVFNLREHYNSEFIIEPNGRYQIDDKQYMPNLRHIPTFPDEDIVAGSKWNSTGEIFVRDFSQPFKLLFPVTYTLFDVQVKDGIRLAQIHYEYVISKDLIDQQYPKDFPLRIVGKCIGILFWDIQKNQPVETKDRYKIIFFFPAGPKAVTSYEIRMNIDSQYKIYPKVTPKQKEKEKEELAKEFKKDNGISVETERRGIVLRMGDVFFDFDSYGLRGDTKNTLDKIIDVLKKKYPDHEIIVEGHTDNVGQKDYNQKLSERRAKTVTEFLKNGMGHDKLSYKGYGPEKPIDDNGTKAGREKNRRVEIIIKQK